MSEKLQEIRNAFEDKEDQEARLFATSESLASDKHPERNEDAFINDAEKKIFAVLDGVGGHTAGEVASRENRNFILQKIEALAPDLTLDQVKEEMAKILAEANQNSYKLVAENPTLHGMASTASLVKLLETQEDGLNAVIGNVGDSRVYVQSASGELRQITLDDNIYFSTVLRDEGEEAARKEQKKFAELTDISSLTEAELKNYKNRNVITGAIGGATPDTAFEPHIYTVKLNNGDKIIITSDGVHDNLTDSEIQEIALNTPPEEISKKLAEAAQARSREGVDRSKKDDITSVVISIEGKKTEAGADNQNIETKVEDQEQVAEIQVESGDARNRESIQSAKNFEELYRAIYSIGEITGAEGSISADEMTSMIEQYRTGTLVIEDVPETNGLRSRVEDLDKIDKLRGEF